MQHKPTVLRTCDKEYHICPEKERNGFLPAVANAAGV